MEPTCASTPSSPATQQVALGRRDFNSAIVTRLQWVGTAVPKATDDHHNVLGDIAELHDLVALNSWQGHDVHTCLTMHGGASCIDAVWTRRLQADSLAKCACVSPSFPLLSRVSACYHLPVSGSIPCLWQCWKQRRRTSSEGVTQHIDIEQLCREAKACSERWQRLCFSVQEALDTYMVLDIEAVTAQVSRLCSQAFPRTNSKHKAPFEDAMLSKMRKHKWQIWKELHRPSGSGLHANIVLRWKLVAQLLRLSRDSSKRSKRIRREKLEAIYAEAHLASLRNNMRSLFRQVRRLAPKRPPTRMALRDESGNLLGPIAEGHKLHEHLTSIFYDAQASPLVIPHCEILPFDVARLAQAINELPAYKAVPKHCLPSGVWKYLSNIVAPWLHNHLRRMWSATLPHIPTIWCSSWITLVPKPGKNGSQIEHWRPISLQESLGKATLKAITQEARAMILSDLTCWPQYAYLPGRSTYDAIAKVLLHCEEVKQLLRSTRSTIFDRREGNISLECAGGLQILVDLKGAFDRAPRLLLQQALLDLPLPASVISLLLAWHQLTPYHLEHGGRKHTIDCNVGVRQGCVAAPLLWVSFMRFWMKHLAGRFGMHWVRKHLTVFADDNHLAWAFTDEGAVHRAIAEAEVFLNTFSEYGMHLNLGKTVAILSVRGKSGSSIRRKFVQIDKGCKLLRLSSTLLVPLVTQHIYLGICVSYGQYASQTLRHRRNCSRKSFLTLRKWWSPSTLPLAKRISLWKICVWTSPLLLSGRNWNGPSSMHAIQANCLQRSAMDRMQSQPHHA